ncbi:hypothetical protein KKF91_04345 [Myxococcota bacterium]|nr:hypothetical protein [Myxococcota bacterium]
MLRLALALLALLALPPLILLFEARRQRARVELGFWAFAQRVGGRVQVAWRQARRGIVTLELPHGAARVRVERGWRGWRVEARVYQQRDFGFVALIAEPPQRPTLWYAPSLEIVEVFPEEAGYPGDVSLESNDEASLRWLLKHEAISALLKAARAEGYAVEICAAHSLIIARASQAKAPNAGAAIEALGPPLLDALKRLSADLYDLAEAARDAGVIFDEAACLACGRPLDDDPWICDGCGARLHRGCREMISGCAQPSCAHAADALTGP